MADIFCTDTAISSAVPIENDQPQDTVDKGSTEAWDVVEPNLFATFTACDIVVLYWLENDTFESTCNLIYQATR